MQYAIERLAVHTEEQLLHPAALLEFRARLRALVEAGEAHEAALLWGSVLEVQHYPPPPPGLLEGLSPGVPAIRAIPCVQEDCARCSGGRGGFRFPFIGSYARRSMLVPVGVPPAQAWNHYHHGGEERFSVEEVRAPVANRHAPRPCGPLVAASSGARAPSGTTPAQLWMVWRDWHQGEIIWREPAYFPVPSWEEGRRDRRAGLIGHFGFSSEPWRRVWACCQLRAGAETVVDRLAAQAVLSFRERHGLVADADVAYAFSS